MKQTTRNLKLIEFLFEGRNGNLLGVQCPAFDALPSSITTARRWLETRHGKVATRDAKFIDFTIIERDYNV